MAKYNTFAVVDCKKRKSVLITSSARKARGMLKTGFKVEVWNENNFVETVYSRQAERLNEYVSQEKQYIAAKQAKAEERNKRRKGHGL